MVDREPQVGEIVHWLHGGTCYAAMVIRLDDNGVLIRPFRALGPVSPDDDRLEAYNSLTSARPTSGWHWLTEHGAE